MKDYGSLIRGITSNINYYIGNKIDKYGIKQGQFEYFLLIYRNPGINQFELARLKNVGKASVTKAIKILENDGFVKRVTDENDRRNISCYISEKGEAIVSDLMTIKSNAEINLFKGFKREDKSALLNYLTLLYDSSLNLVKEIDTKRGE